MPQGDIKGLMPSGVLILVLMEEGPGQASLGVTRILTLVLILVLMEEGPGRLNDIDTHI